MKHFNDLIKSLIDNDSISINYDTHKLEQKTRNFLKSALTQALLDDMAEEIEDVIVERVEKGIGIMFMTKKGLIPAQIEITMKNTEMDMREEAKVYAEKAAEKAKRRAERRAAAEEKMIADEKKREEKRALRAAKAAAKQTN